MTSLHSAAFDLDTALATRVLELSPGRAHIYGGSYDEYVASTGREAPGMRA